MTDFSELAIFQLLPYAHATAQDGLCAMEAVAWLEGLPHSDHPVCTCPVIAGYVRSLNDTLPHKKRQRLTPYLPRLVNTVSPSHEWERLHYLVSRAFGSHWLIVLRAYKLNDVAAEFEKIAAKLGDAGCFAVADLAARAVADLVGRADLADLVDFAGLAARPDFTDLEARPDFIRACRVAFTDFADLFYQAHFDTLDGVLKIGAPSPGFSKPIAPRIEKYRQLERPNV